MIRPKLMRPHNYTCRIEVTDQASGSIEVTSLDLLDAALKDDRNDKYKHIDDLPVGLRENLALLMTMPYEKPTEYAEGVGRRINKTVYWVEGDS